MKKKLEAILAQLEELIAESDEESVADEDADEEEEKARVDRFVLVSEALQHAVDEIDKALVALDD